MPLSDNETSGFYDILSLLKDSDLESLSSTISHNILNVTSREDAVKTIIKYTSHPFELFKRKKIKKSILFLYSDKYKIAQCFPGDSKSDIIRKILVAWKSQYDVEDMEDEDTPIDNSQPQLPFYQTTQQVQCQSNSIEPSSHNYNQTPQQTQLEQNKSDINCWYDSNLQPSMEDKDFSLEFCKWFYIMLNNLNNTNNNNAHNIHNQTLTVSHFFEDCVLNLVTQNQSTNNSEMIRGADLVCQRITNLTTSCNMSYNPNMSEMGLKTLCDSYGRRVIIIAGTIQSGVQIGLFEQQFGLIRDCNDGYNWKIKFSRLALSNNIPLNTQVSLENTKEKFTLVPM